MHPSIHPDHAFASRLQDPNSEPFQSANDRRRGFVPKSASIHSISPSNTNPSPPVPFSGGSGGQTPDFIHPVSGSVSNQNPIFNASPLQNHVTVDYSIPTQGVPNMVPNFDFNSTGDGQNQSLWGVDTTSNQPLPVQPVDEFLPPDMGFDWMNWMSTANVAMGPVEEQYGIR